MNVFMKIICPYCGHENHFKTKYQAGRGFYYCFLDSGGCDGQFVIDYKLHFKVISEIKRIEGEEKKAAEMEGR